MSNLDVARLRAETPGVAYVNHFNYAGSGLPPQPVLDAVLDHLNLEAQIGGYEAHDEALPRLEASYDSIAKLLNAHRVEIAQIENATRAWDMAAYAIPFEAGDRVITSPWEYASNLVAILQLQKRYGFEIEVVPNDANGQIDLDALETALKKPTKAVFLTHMPTNGGVLQPAEAVGALIRQHQPDAWYVLDACQTAGQVPLDVAALQVDVLSATSRKYLRGPRGAGFLYMRKERIPYAEPPLLDLHAASMTSATTYEIRPDARRFENWESFVAGRLGLGAAVDYAMNVGLDAIWQQVQKQGALLREKLMELPGVRVHDVGEIKGGIVTFSRDGVPSERIREALKAADVNTSLSNIYTTYLDPRHEAIGTYIRASVHYVTTDGEINALIDAIPEK